MKNSIFNSVKLNRPPRNRFDLSHDVKLSFDMGELVPVMNMEVLPGDSITISPQNFIRFAPMVAPIMHRVKVKQEFFFVPNRLSWAEWEDFITGQSDVVPPWFSNDELQLGSVSDYMGVPPGEYGSPLQFSALPFAAYARIWNEYYRDQNLQDELNADLVAGNNNGNADLVTMYSNAPLKRAWGHDYFTSALPFAQKGDSVSIPLVVEDDIPVTFNPNGNPGSFKDPDTGADVGVGPIVQATGPTPFTESTFGGALGTDPAAYDPRGTLTVDVQAEATDINTLRWAFRMQEWLERNARAGTRYVENLLAHWGVRSPDARLQRPEFIGSTSGNAVISEVLSTTESTAESQALGQMAGHGVSLVGGNSFTYHAKEHGFIIGIISLVPETAYQDGLHKKFSRLSRFDYAWPVFANLGEQEIKQIEVWAQTDTPDATFGYIPRYAEYKYENSRVAGQFRTTQAFWHLGRRFTADPALNEDFIECVPDKRIFAVTSTAVDSILAHCICNVAVSRLLPRFGIPSI